jgi:hypothetical protein
MWFNENVLSHPDSSVLCLRNRRVLTSGEDVETDLTTDRVCKAEMTEFLFKSSNHGSSDFVFLPVSYNHDLEVGIAYTVELFKVVSLLCAGLLACLCREQPREAHLAFRPTGETLIIPFLNSMKVPLCSISISLPLQTEHLPLDWNIDLTEVS